MLSLPGSTLFLGALALGITGLYLTDQHYHAYMALKEQVSEYQAPPALTMAQVDTLDIQLHCRAMRTATNLRERKRFAHVVVEEADFSTERLSGDNDICVAQAMSEINPRLAFKD